MGIDIDTRAFGLLEDLFHHLQVVTGDQNSFAGFGTQLNRCRYRMTICVGVGSIQKAHDSQILLTTFHGEANIIHQAQI